MSSPSKPWVDEKQMTFVPETDVVMSVFPEEALDENSWPCFNLVDATVYHRSAEGQPELHWMANLFFVNYDGPFVVRGFLDFGEHEDRAKPEAQNMTPVQLNLVTQYSLGISETEGPEIWASSICGWFLIKPSPKYMSIFRSMCAMTTAYYSMFDIFCEKSTRLELELLLFHWSVEEGKGDTLEMCKELLKQYAPFLVGHLSTMDRRRADALRANQDPDSPFAWTQTSLWSFLRQECSDIIATIQRRFIASSRGVHLHPTTPRPPSPPLVGREATSPLPPSSPRHNTVDTKEIANSASSELSVTPFLRKRKSPHKDRPQDETSVVFPAAPVEHEIVKDSQPSMGSNGMQNEGHIDRWLTNVAETTSDIDDKAFRQLLEVLDEIWVELQAKARPSSRINLNTIRAGIWFRCRMHYHEPPMVLLYFARRLLAEVPPYWKETAFYETLRHDVVSNTTASLEQLPHDKLLEKLSRRRPPLASENTITSVISSTLAAPVKTDLPDRSKIMAGAPANSELKRSPSPPSPPQLLPPSPSPKSSPVSISLAPPQVVDYDYDDSEVQIQQPQYRRAYNRLHAAKGVKNPAKQRPRHKLAARDRGFAVDKPIDFSKISQAPNTRAYVDEDSTSSSTEEEEEEGGENDYDNEEEDEDVADVKDEIEEQHENEPNNEARLQNGDIVMKNHNTEHETSECVLGDRDQRTRRKKRRRVNNLTHQDRLRLYLRAESLPSMVPRGPLGTWVCSEDNCGHMVRGANLPAGLDKVQAHIELHSRIDKYKPDKKVKRMMNHAIAEGSKTQLPISNLLDKIRQAGSKTINPSAISILHSKQHGRTADGTSSVGFVTHTATALVPPVSVPSVRHPPTSAVGATTNGAAMPSVNSISSINGVSHSSTNGVNCTLLTNIGGPAGTIAVRTTATVANELNRNGGGGYPNPIKRAFEW